MSQQRTLLTGGLSITFRALPALLWTYVFNLGLAVLFSIPLNNQLAAVTAHSFAAQRLIGGFDIGVAADVVSKTNQNSGGIASVGYLAIPIYFILYFLLVPGTLFCYQTDTPARLSTLLQSGVAHFWRFVRITLVSFIVFGIILGPLLMARNAWSAHVDEHIVGVSATLYNLAALVLIGLVAAALRVYFDLVEVYTVQLGLQFRSNISNQPDRRIRRTFGPAWRTLRRNFFRAYFTFVFLTLLGLSAVIVTARIAMHSLAQPHTWQLFLLAQTGLFLMLLTRFWQRGAETILTLDNPLPPPIVIIDEPYIPPTPPLDPEPSLFDPGPSLIDPEPLPLDPEPVPPEV